MWSGAVTNIPEGWALCDGSNNTPDLRGRFVVGHDPSDGDYDVIGNDAQQSNSGGSGIGQKRHSLTIAELPAHQHGGGDHVHTIGPNNNVQNGTLTVNRMQGGGGYGVYLNSHVEPSGDIIDLEGSNQPHENRPPYYALAFIMKL
jgi:microcystin-dependent protein